MGQDLVNDISGNKRASERELADIGMLCQNFSYLNCGAMVVTTLNDPGGNPARRASSARVVQMFERVRKKKSKYAIVRDASISPSCTR